jgi:hypothetical protein
MNINAYQCAYVIAQTSCLKADIEYVRAYIDDLLIITKGTYLEHLQKLATVLTWLQAGLKVKANKSWYAQELCWFLRSVISKIKFLRVIYGQRRP